LREGFTAQPEPTLEKQRLEAVFEPPAKTAKPRPWRLIVLSAAALVLGGFLFWPRHKALETADAFVPQSRQEPEKLELVAGPGDLGTVSVRHKAVDSGEVSEFDTRLQGDLVKPLTPDQAPRFFLAACAAEFAEILRESEYSAGDLHAVEQVLLRTSQALPMDKQVAELLKLVREASGLPRSGD
jgi:hypothetical protein